MHVSYCRLLAAIVIAVTTVVVAPLSAQDTTGRKDTLPVQPPVLPAPPPPVPAPVTPPAPPAPPAPPTLEQIRYVEGLRTATRGVAQLRDGLSRVARTQASDSVRRRHPCLRRSPLPRRPRRPRHARRPRSSRSATQRG